MKIKRVVVNAISASGVFPTAVRRRILRAAGANIAADVVILSGCVFRQPGKLILDRGTFIGYRCTFEGEASIRFGKNCMVATGVTFLTTTHEIGEQNCRAGAPIHQPIEVGDGTWIGAGVIVFPGVVIGAGCVIGAGSVVTESCDPSSLYVGSPARKLKTFEKHIIEEVSL